MDLSSAVQFLLAYEASLKLAPGQKPPPPSASLFTQLSDAVRAIAKERDADNLQARLASLPPSVWSDWPLCCGVDLASRELKAARSLPPSLLQERGLLSLFLALHSCAEGGVSRAACLGLHLLTAMPRSPSDDPAPFPAAHLAARVGHRLINAAGTLDLVGFEGERINDDSDDPLDVWERFCAAPCSILATATAGPKFARAAVPHEAASFRIAQETAVMLDALCASQAQMGPMIAGISYVRRSCRRLSFWTSCQLVYRLTALLHMDENQASAERFLSKLYSEAAALPAYNPVLLLQSFYRNMSSGIDHGSMKCSKWSEMLPVCRALLWAPLSLSAPLRKLRPADGYTAMRLGLEDLGHQEAGKEDWTGEFTRFVMRALQSGLVQPELILRARPQLLEGLVEGLAKTQMQAAVLPGSTTVLVTLLARSPAVAFHLRKFFSHSGCLQAIQAMPNPDNTHKHLIRLLGPRAAQSDTGPLYNIRGLISDNAAQKKKVEDPANDFQSFSAFPHMIIEGVIRDLTLDLLRQPGYAQPILQYLSELAEEIAVPKRPHGGAQYGALMVVGLGKACLAFSTLVARALQDIGEPGSKGKGVRGLRGTGARGGVIAQVRWRNQLAETERELCLLRRRVLRELLPLAEAREAALWEGVREEEAVAALRD